MATAGVLAAPAQAMPTSATAAAHAPPVVVIAVPDLRWSDVQQMPGLRAALASAAIGNLSVRSQGDETRCGAGLLEISAGTRVRSSDAPCSMGIVDIASERRHNRSSIYAGRVGALGSALAAAGLRTAVLGEIASPMLADENGHVGSTVDSVAAGLAVADVVGAVDDELLTGDRAVRRAALDSELREQLSEATGRATVLVVGSSDGVHGPAHLHVAAVIGLARRALTSASTHRSSYVQLIDVAPTILSLEHIDVPDSMVGRPMHVSGLTPLSLSALVDDDKHARAAADVGGPTRNGLGIAVAVALTLWLVGWRRAHIAASALLVAPVMTYLVQIVPWWRWGAVPYALIVAGTSLLVAGALALVFRGNSARLMLAAPTLTAAVLAIDQLAGAPLDLSAPMGDNPLVAGRFHGMGNVAFALMCASMLLLAAIWSSGLETRRGRIALVAAVTVVALVIDGAPFLGDDFGGVLALVPAAMLLGALVAGVALTWRRVLIGAAVAVAIAVGIAFADYARPESQQTHIGQFVGHVLHGGSDPVIRRKVRAVVRSVGNIALDVPVVIALIGIVSGRVREQLSDLEQPGVANGVVVCATLAVLGGLLNDSGVVVVAAVLLAVGPPIMSVSRP